jgi:hypothetical protein
VYFITLSLLAHIIFTPSKKGALKCNSPLPAVQRRTVSWFKVKCVGFDKDEAIWAQFEQTGRHHGQNRLKKMKDSQLELGTSQISVIQRTQFETRNAYKVLVIKVVLENTHFKDLKEYGSIISY